MSVEKTHEHDEVLKPHKLIEQLLGVEWDSNLEFVRQVLLIQQTRFQVGDTFDVLQVLQLNLRWVELRLLKHARELVPKLLSTILKALFNHAEMEYYEHREEYLLQIATVLLLLSIDHIN